MYTTHLFLASNYLASLAGPRKLTLRSFRTDTHKRAFRVFMPVTALAVLAALLAVHDKP